MADCYQRQARTPDMQAYSFDDRLAMLVEHEVSQRKSRQLGRLVRAAKMSETATLEEIDYIPTRPLDRSQINSLSSCDWIERNLNLLIIGPTGIGKTFVACAFGTEACRVKLSVAFRKVADLLEDIASAEADGSLSKLRTSLVKPRLLILDDLGIGSISASAAQFLLSVIDRRIKSGSLLITSQWSTEHWHDFFGDPTVADAILDRVVHCSYRLVMTGDSIRKQRARKRLETNAT